MKDDANTWKPFVLVVDSDYHRGRSLVSRLRTEGYYVASSGCGKDALEYAAENEPDAIVSDWHLSDMAGTEFTHTLKGRSFRTKVLLMSDQTDWRLLRKAIECGGDDLLSRPVSIQYLVRILNRSSRLPQAASPAPR
jgi:DNA-binding response OmpR family regulator